MLVKTAVWMFGTVVVLVLAIVAINAFDEDLTPEAIALLKPPANPYRSDENLYIAMAGFDAPQGESVIAVGETRIAASNEREAATLLSDPVAFSARAAKNDTPKMAFKGKVDFCRPVIASCWTDVERRKAEIDSLLADNQELYQRYLNLHRLRGYYVTETPSYFMSFPYNPAEERSLFLASTALRIKTGGTVQERSAALVDLRDDIATWRLMLVGDGPLAPKMGAIVRLHGDYAVLADAIADPNTDLSSLAAKIQDILDLLRIEDWKLRNVFAYEYRIFAPSMEQIRRDKANLLQRNPNGEKPEWWEPYWAQIEGYFLKVDATLNLRARDLAQVQRVADADPKDFLVARDAYRSWVEQHAPGLNYVYNPIGKAIVAAAAGVYDKYPLYAYDVAAFQRLVRLGYEIRSRKIGANDIPAFIAEHPDWATHPVSGQPFLWDVDKQELAMQPLGKPPKDRRFRIPVRAAARAQ